MKLQFYFGLDQNIARFLNYHAETDRLLLKKLMLQAMNIMGSF